MMALQKTNPEIQSGKQIRISVITHWLKTIDVRKAQYMAGHRHVSSTEKYKQYDLKDLQEQLKKFHPLN
jgi:integrase/recombinase XerD